MRRDGVEDVGPGERKRVYRDSGVEFLLRLVILPDGSGRGGEPVV